MKALLIPNLLKKYAENCTKQIINILLENEIECLIDESIADLFDGYNITYGKLDKLISDCTYVIAIGGDGTIIHTSKLASNHNKKLVGVNVGRLGFLAALEPDQLHLLSKLSTGDFDLEKRLMIEVTVKKKSGECISVNALNEIVVSRGAISKMIELEMRCNDTFVDRYRADGIICCTPTGSTAYSLSAGGPIVSPLIDSIIFTPICPHSLFSRPIIYPSDSKLQIKLIEDGHIGDGCEYAFLTVDGAENISLDFEDTVIVTQSTKKVQLVSFTNKQFYEVLNKKMMNRFRG